MIGKLPAMERETEGGGWEGAYLGECGLFLLPDGTAAVRYALTRGARSRGYAAEARR